MDEVLISVRKKGERAGKKMNENAAKAISDRK
jgi:hypothetical protein